MLVRVIFQHFEEERKPWLLWPHGVTSADPLIGEFVGIQLD